MYSVSFLLRYKPIVVIAAAAAAVVVVVSLTTLCVVRSRNCTRNLLHSNYSWASLNENSLHFG